MWLSLSKLSLSLGSRRVTRVHIASRPQLSPITMTSTSPERLPLLFWHIRWHLFVLSSASRAHTPPSSLNSGASFEICFCTNTLRVMWYLCVARQLFLCCLFSFLQVSSGSQLFARIDTTVYHQLTAYINSSPIDQEQLPALPTFRLQLAQTSRQCRLDDWAFDTARHRTPLRDILWWMISVIE